MKRNKTEIIEYLPYAIAGIGLILLWPLLKGLFSISSTAGDILNAPGKFIEALNKQTDQAVLDTIHDILWKHFNETTFDPQNKKDAALYNEVLHGKFDDKNALLDLWKQKKGISNLLIGTRTAVFENMMEEIKKQMGNLW